MKEENALMEEDMSEDDSDLSSDESIDLDSPEKTRFAICRERIPEVYVVQYLFLVSCSKSHKSNCIYQQQKNAVLLLNTVISVFQI